jgi:hypothetical protein
MLNIADEYVNQRRQETHHAGWTNSIVWAQYWPRLLLNMLLVSDAS